MYNLSLTCRSSFFLKVLTGTKNVIRNILFVPQIKASESLKCCLARWFSSKFVTLSQQCSCTLHINIHILLMYHYFRVNKIQRHFCDVFWENPLFSFNITYFLSYFWWVHILSIFFSKIFTNYCMNKTLRQWLFLTGKFSIVSRDLHCFLLQLNPTYPLAV